MEETGFDGLMADELAFVRRRFELVRLAGQQPSTTEVRIVSTGMVSSK